MLIPRPRPMWRRVASSPAFFGAVQTIVTATMTGVASLSLLLAGRRSWSIAAGVGSALVVVAGICKAALEVRHETQRESIHELEGCLETLLAIVNSPDAPDYDKGMRITLHRPIEKGVRFQQVVDYVGDDRGGKTAGRIFPPNAGIVAQVLQSRKALAASREIANHELYVRELVDKWHYIEPDARRRDMSAMSWIAVPIEYGHTLQGLLYMDSTRPHFFDEPAREKACIAASVGIAKFTVRRYTH